LSVRVPWLFTGPWRGANLPVRSMNSVTSASALSVRGSIVESVRVANDIVNMLLQGTYRIHQKPVQRLHEETWLRRSLQGITTGKVRWIDGTEAYPWMALGVRNCMAILRCCRLPRNVIYLARRTSLSRTYHVSLYGLAVMARPRNIVWLFMKNGLRLEKIAPLDTNKSLAIRASEITTKSWLPIQTEKNGPNIFDQASRARSG